jgi:hypothetical protein
VFSWQRAGKRRRRHRRVRRWRSLPFSPNVKERERDGREMRRLWLGWSSSSGVCVCTLRIDFVRVPLGRPPILLLLLERRERVVLQLPLMLWLILHTLKGGCIVVAARSTAASLPFFSFLFFFNPPLFHE